MRPTNCSDFFRRLPVGLLVSMFLACPSTAIAEVTEITLLFVGAENSPAYRGARQGLEEAQAQGEFLGQHYTLTFQPAPASTPIDATAVIAAVDQAALLALVTAYPALPILNVSSAADEARRDCHPNLLHVLPSSGMQADAVAQWKILDPDATVTAQAWHPDFEKYAAAQLNKRYRESFERPMDDPAWAGWASVKLLSDTVAREQTADPAIILDALRTRLAFDGQKGVDMSFRADGQLRQPLLLIADGKIVGEAPVRGVAELEDLDSLGRVECVK